MHSIPPVYKLGPDVPFLGGEALQDYGSNKKRFPVEKLIQTVMSECGSAVIQVLLKPSPEDRWSAQDALLVTWFQQSVSSFGSLQSQSSWSSSVEVGPRTDQANITPRVLIAF
jgi:hypothetical protein